MPAKVAHPASIDAVSFASAMQAFAPFESEPLVAVAVSGGPDSLALLLLLDVWARERGGSALALTVDHGLRSESAAEARQVGGWAAARGISHDVLNWSGDKPQSGLQAAARDARYDLMTEACTARGILHLAFAHHADDQAETVLFRRERGSGAAGLAGMPASRSLGAVRLIRPLLGWPKAALAATCAAFAQPFIEDPSNRSDLYARTALRQRLATDSGERALLLAAAVDAALARAEGDEALAGILGSVAEIRPDGVVIFDRAGLAAVEPGLRRAALAAGLRTVGGQAFAADADAIERLDTALQAGAFTGASLSGCVVRLWRGGVMLCREPARAAQPVALDENLWRRWDERFRVRIASSADRLGPLAVGALGATDYAVLRRDRTVVLPAIVGAGLPAVRSGDRVVAVPAIGWLEEGAGTVEQRFLPLWPLSPETFTVVSAGPDIMSAKGERRWRQRNDPDRRFQTRCAF